jgi:hypothetical protein
MAIKIGFRISAMARIPATMATQPVAMIINRTTHVCERMSFMLDNSSFENNSQLTLQEAPGFQ